MELSKLSMVGILHLRSLCIYIIVTAFFSMNGCDVQTLAQSTIQTEGNERVLLTTQALVKEYDFSKGLFKDTGWWNSANGITALANASRLLGTRQYDALFANTLLNAQKRFPLFLNEFYDDEGWWALAWIDVYELHHDERYLTMAKSIFLDMTRGWSDACGGGIWWKKNTHYKNAIANELFLTVAARLARQAKYKERSNYIAWARKEYRWFITSGMINEDSLINDGLNASCHNNGGKIWSYNQGVILDGLINLGKISDRQDTKKLAEKISQAAMMHLADKAGILHDVCEPECGEDGIQFKGIFARNLLRLYKRDESRKIGAFLQANAQSIWANSRTADNHFSTTWTGPARDDKTGALISALDILTSAQAIHRSMH